ncbi:MAG: dienelactone hydrolase family protein [Hyphomonadaceae bacterium]
MAAATLAERIAFLEPWFEVAKPDGLGPFPLLVMLHGCGGRQPFLDGYAEVAREQGVASLIVDSHKPRRIGMIGASLTVCTGARLQGRERAGDLFAAFAWARAQAWVDASRIMAAGWSHGGWTVLDALALRPGAEMARATKLSGLPDEPLQGLAAAFLGYPYAGVAALSGRRRLRLDVPISAIVCGRDTIVGTKAPLAALSRMRGRGAAIDVSVFDTATHAFECDTALDPRVRYDRDLTLRAHDLMRDMILRAA